LNAAQTSSPASACYLALEDVMIQQTSLQCGRTYTRQALDDKSNWHKGLLSRRLFNAEVPPIVPALYVAAQGQNV